MRLIFAILLFLSFATENAQAQASTGSISIAAIRTGWWNDIITVDTGGTYINPAHCVASDGYYSKTGDPGFKTFYAALSMAFAMGKNVTLFISNNDCSESRPRIIGVTIAK